MPSGDAGELTGLCTSTTMLAVGCGVLIAGQLGHGTSTLHFRIRMPCPVPGLHHPSPRRPGWLRDEATGRAVVRHHAGICSGMFANTCLIEVPWLINQHCLVSRRCRAR
jgi:hypothetical protein